MRLLTLALLILVPIHPSWWLYKRLTLLGVLRSDFPSISTQFPSTDYFSIPEIIQAEDLAFHKQSGNLIFLGQTEGQKRYGWFPPLANFARPEDGQTARAKLWAVDPKVSPSDTIVHAVDNRRGNLAKSGFKDTKARLSHMASISIRYRPRSSTYKPSTMFPAKSTESHSHSQTPVSRSS